MRVWRYMYWPTTIDTAATTIEPEVRWGWAWVLFVNGQARAWYYEPQ